MNKLPRKLNITIITISNGDTKELFLTLNSIDSQSIPPFESIVVASNTSNDIIESIKQRFTKKYRKFIFNQDSSLYNAMNLGLLNTTGNHVLFLNAGDILYAETSLEIIDKKVILGRCNSFRIIQSFSNTKYIRPGLSKLTNWAHPGFIAPSQKEIKKNLLFDETKKIGADGIWMTSNINKYGNITHLDVITSFQLGGISNSPSIKTIIIRLKEKNIISAIKESGKIILYKSMRKSSYYRLIAHLNSYDLQK